MAIKTFTSGEVLTAANTNTYLNNGGLVYITEATATNGAGSLVFNNCFSATYENYRMVAKFSAATAGYPSIVFQMRVGGANAGTALYQYTGTGRSSSNIDQSFGNVDQTVGSIGMLTGSFSADIYSPFRSTVQTLTTSETMYYNGSTFIRRSIGTWHNIVASYDGISFTPTSSTFTNTFNVKIYGYRQA